MGRLLLLIPVVFTIVVSIWASGKGRDHGAMACGDYSNNPPNIRVEFSAVSNVSCGEVVISDIKARHKECVNDFASGTSIRIGWDDWKNNHNNHAWHIDDYATDSKCRGNSVRYSGNTSDDCVLVERLQLWVRVKNS